MNRLNRSEYPFTSHYFSIDGHRLHYIEEGKGNTLLFVHGTPSWSFDFRHVIKKLSREFHCVAIDHIGFGLSDKPTSYDYSTQNHSRVLERFIVEKGLKDLTLVVHDFGGPIGLSFAIKHPEIIKKIVVLNSWLWSSENNPAFKKLRKVLRNPLLPFLYRYLNFSPRFLMPASFGKHKMTKEIHRHYIQVFRNKNERYGPLAFAKSLLNDQKWFEELWSQRKILQEKEFLFLWGMKDSFISESYLEKFSSGFPKHRIEKFTMSGHFPQEEEGEKVADLIGKFSNAD